METSQETNFTTNMMLFPCARTVRCRAENVIDRAYVHGGECATGWKRAVRPLQPR